MSYTPPPSNSVPFVAGSGYAPPGPSDVDFSSPPGIAGHASAGQAGQTAVAVGLAGLIGPVVAGQAGQTASGVGAVTGVAGTITASQAGQSAVGSYLAGGAAYLLVGGVRSNSVTTRGYSADGAAQWVSDAGADVLSLAIDGNNDFYTGANNGYLRKWDSGGAEITTGWAKYVTDFPTGLGCDSSNGLFVATNRINGLLSRPIRHYSGSGSLDFQQAYSTAQTCVAVDGADYAIVGCVQDGTISVRKIYTDGSEAWNRSHTVTVRAVAVDSSDNVYIAGDRFFSSPNYYTSRMYNSSGTQQWARDLHGAQINAIAVDGSGNVYVAGVRTSNITTRKYDSGGTLIWSADHGGTVHALKIGPSDGYIYTAGARSSNVTLRKYDPSDGTEITGNWPVDTGATAYALDFFSLSTIATNVPALAIGIALGVPMPSFYSAPPALPIRIALAVPTPSDPPEPPIVGDLQVIYRLWIATVGTMIELPLRSLQSRRRRNDSTWLVVECPGISQSTADWLQSVIGAAVVVDSGSRNSAGSETMGLFLRAYLSEVSYSQTHLTGIATLTCRVDAINENLQTRNLEGVISVSRDGSRYIVRCASVNHRLRPGDTATYGAISFVVHSVKYSIDPSVSWMELEEAAP